ncbi:LptF/LptG family permease [Fontisphaera persica]|uniref:LptF/LptG family permease n=1 Tax=Fontisphaera persica TaxID=2974023 RepID=UPI0024BF66F6|nr:LptF/LptG family permease [Fontisphaera persica]WCJ59857.1 LptF/LptG family permease [Fontisphaera persica]
MRTLHQYLVRQTLATVVMTVGVFTGILLLGNVLREVTLLLLNEQVRAVTVFKALGLLVPYVLVFALPMGLLTAMLLTFGRLSAEQELNAMRGGGVSVVSLVTPVLLMAVGFSCLSGFINLYLAPSCRMAYKDMLAELRQVRPATVLTAGRFVKDIPGYIIYVSKVTDAQMHDVLISKVDKEGEVTTILQAARGVVEPGPETNQFVLRLFEARGSTLEKGVLQAMPFYAGEAEFILDLPKQRARSIKLNEMTFFDLLEERRRVEQLMGGALGLEARLLPAGARDKVLAPLKVQLHHQVAFSFACLGFTLIGIPLGIRSHRKETSVGVAVALVLVLVYYSFFILADALATRAQWHPWLFCWIPNFLFQGMGMWLLWRVNRQ